MDIRTWSSQGLAGLALALAVGALLCAPVVDARANALPTGPPCDCRLDSCRVVNGNLTGFCDCTDNCGCGYYTDPDTGNRFPRCLEV